MPKAKVASKSKITPKVAPKKKLSGLTIAAIVVVGAFLLVGGYLKSTMQKSGINEVREFSSDVVRSMPVAEERTCAKVDSFTLSDNCAVGSYQMAKFTCGLKDRVRVIGVDSTTAAKDWKESGEYRKSCKSMTDLYNQAKDTCAAACPSPTPTPTPKVSEGCYYKKVTCIKAPCKDELVCPPPSVPPMATSKPAQSPTPKPTSTPTSTAVPTSCANQTVSFSSYTDPCKQYGNDYYAFINYKCGNESTTHMLGSHGTCKTKDYLVNMASKECQKNVCSN